MAGIAYKLRSLIAGQSVNGWADERGFSPQTVHEWIAKDRMPGRNSMKALVAATGMPEEWWLSGEEPMLLADAPKEAENPTYDAADGSALARAAQAGAPVSRQAAVSTREMHGGALEAARRALAAAHTPEAQAAAADEAQRRHDALKPYLWFIVQVTDCEGRGQEDEPPNWALIQRVSAILEALMGGRLDYAFLMAHPHLVNEAADLVLAYDQAAKAP